MIDSDSVIEERTEKPVQQSEKLPHTDFDRPVFCVFGLPFDAVSMEQTMARLSSALNGRRCFFSTPNLNGLNASHRDAAFRDSVLGNDLSLVDGVPILWLARLAGVPVVEKVAGSDLFDALMKDQGPNLKIYFFGGPKGAAAMASQRMNAMSKSLRCVGFASPGFGTVEELSAPRIIDEINQSKADFLVLALGTVKGHVWIMRNLPRLTMPIVSHLGAVVNFVAGTIERAPDAFSRSGFEWVWRIKEEPALWRRYWEDGFALLRLIALRALPLVLLRTRSRFRKSVAPQLDISHVSGIDVNDIVQIKMSGTWLAEDLEPVRNAFRKISREPGDVALELSEMVWFDGALIGLLMLLYGHQKKGGRAFKIVGVTASMRRIFKLNCSDFLLD